MRLCIFAFGKLKTPGLREAADYYTRLSRSWISTEEIELKPIAVPEKKSSLRIQIQEKEGVLLLDRIESRTNGKNSALNCESRGNSIILLLDENGKGKSTQQWATALQNWESDGISTIALCIGSSLGFSKQVRDRAHGQISLGPQTLPHELARVVLMEQIFRAFSVLKGHPYHNEGS